MALNLRLKLQIALHCLQFGLLVAGLLLVLLKFKLKCHEYLLLLIQAELEVLQMILERADVHKINCLLIECLELGLLLGELSLELFDLLGHLSNLVSNSIR